MEKPRERRKGREYQSFKNVPHFVRAIGEPLVVVKKPRYTFECYNVCHFGWEFNHSDANMEMRDRNPQATYEKDRKRCEKFLAKRERLLEQVGEGEPNAVSLQEHSTTNKSTATNGESRAQLELSTGDQNSTAGSWRWSSAAGRN